jgi:hypothetical protein
VYFPLFLKSIKNGKEIPLDFETEKNSLWITIYNIEDY